MAVPARAPLVTKAAPVTSGPKAALAAVPARTKGVTVLALADAKAPAKEVMPSVAGLKGRPGGGPTRRTTDAPAAARAERAPAVAAPITGPFVQVPAPRATTLATNGAKAYVPKVVEASVREARACAGRPVLPATVIQVTTPEALDRIDGVAPPEPFGATEATPPLPKGPIEATLPVKEAVTRPPPGEPIAPSEAPIMGARRGPTIQVAAWTP